MKYHAIIKSTKIILYITLLPIRGMFFFINFFFVFIAYVSYLFFIGVGSYYAFSALPDKPFLASIGIGFLIFVAHHTIVPRRMADGKYVFEGFRGSGGSVQGGGTGGSGGYGGGGGCGGGGC
ncbi:MAG: hypothetical protein ACRBM6_06895 [Geminicoccales bacterium]